MSQAAVLRAETGVDSTQDVLIRQMDHARGLPLPAYATPHAAGMDVTAAVEDSLTLAPGAHALIPTGIAVALPPGYELQVRARSGLAAKNGIGLVNGIGTIDADYRGEIKIILINYGTEPFTVERGMRIAQFVVARHETVVWRAVESLPESDRGAGGFGSTGTR